MAIIFMSVRNVVVGVIYRKNTNKQLAFYEFLILHRILLWEGWEFPKGGVEKKDRAEEVTLRREIEEETGLKNIRIITKLPYRIKYK